ncbi:COG1611 Predicted Rossmann fold nucleotide-binding protein [Candidatus Nanopelagicaceae bacterium]
MRIAVYCSSSPTIDSKFIDLSFELGASIAESGADLVSGGGHISSMGAISRGARSKGGKTIGIIPQKLVDIEFADHDSDELVIVESMRTRKAKIEELADAFIALPGGLGTLEELIEIWVGRYLGFHNKPIVILDPFGVYEKLHELVIDLENQEFVKPGMRDLVLWATNIEDSLAFIRNHYAK